MIDKNKDSSSAVTTKACGLDIGTTKLPLIFRSPDSSARISGSGNDDHHNIMGFIQSRAMHGTGGYCEIVGHFLHILHKGIRLTFFFLPLKLLVGSCGSFYIFWYAFSFPTITVCIFILGTNIWLLPTAIYQVLSNASILGFIFYFFRLCFAQDASLLTKKMGIIIIILAYPMELGLAYCVPLKRWVR